jgi:hypothetical protein
VAGATGLVGTALVKQLLSEGFSVRVLTRNVVSARNKLPYPGLQFVAPSQWGQAVCGTNAVVNLAGRFSWGWVDFWTDMRSPCHV